MTKFQEKFDQAIWKVVANIKPGRVMAYGEVARAAGYPRHARMVSQAMTRSTTPLPWHRVLRSDRRLASGDTVRLGADPARVLVYAKGAA